MNMTVKMQHALALSWYAMDHETVNSDGMKKVAEIREVGSAWTFLPQRFL
jgi:hypothetical protein